MSLSERVVPSPLEQESSAPNGTSTGSSLSPPAIISSSKNVLQFECQIDDNKTTFLPGQRIEGHVSLHLKHAAPTKLLRVRFTGTVLTYMSQSEASSFGAQASSIYLFKEIHNLSGSGSLSTPIVTIPAGEHVYPFVFRVPPTNLPASFQGAYGRIRYEVTAVFIRPGFVKKVVSIPITVPSTRDVMAQDLQQPVTVKKQAAVGRWWWKSGHIDITATLPRSGFASEETAPILIDIVNHSNHGLTIKDVSLKQKVLYKTYTETRGPRTEHIHRLNFMEKIEGGTRKITRLIHFPIPPSSIMSPSIKTPILQVNHFITFKVVSSSPVSGITKIILPVVVGGFPYVLFDESQARRSVDTLPLYSNDQNHSGATTPADDLSEPSLPVHSYSIARRIMPVTSERIERLLQPDEESEFSHHDSFAYEISTPQIQDDTSKPDTDNDVASSNGNQDEQAHASFTDEPVDSTGHLQVIDTLTSSLSERTTSPYPHDNIIERIGEVVEEEQAVQENVEQTQEQNTPGPFSTDSTNSNLPLQDLLTPRINRDDIQVLTPVVQEENVIPVEQPTVDLTTNDVDDGASTRSGTLCEPEKDQIEQDPKSFSSAAGARSTPDSVSIVNEPAMAVVSLPQEKQSVVEGPDTAEDQENETPAMTPTSSSTPSIQSSPKKKNKKNKRKGKSKRH